MKLMKIIDGSHNLGPLIIRFYLTPMTRWGRLYLHILHRPDADRHVHDHPFDFWTFPLASYVEEIGLKGATRVVKPWRLHKRPAEYRHRIISFLGRSRVFTLVWRKQSRREWGFWVLGIRGYHWVDWKVYRKIQEPQKLT